MRRLRGRFLVSDMLSKSGSGWTRNELIAYNIKIVPQTPEQFFGAVGVSLTHLDPLIITGSTTDTTNLSDTTLRYLTHLDLATHASHESFIDEFSRQTLDLLGYSERGLALLTRYNIPLTISGKNKNAQTDVCLVDGRTMILLTLQEDKTLFSYSDPEPQVIAEAIAAYQYNNDKRERRDMATLDEMVFPCITMVGTHPTFYLVPVSRGLSDAVAIGQYPPAPTEVWKCVTVAGHNRSSSEGPGMENPEYRRVVLERLMAFKTLAKSHWEKFLM
jgi:hypothetical protein